MQDGREKLLEEIGEILRGAGERELKMTVQFVRGIRGAEKRSRKNARKRDEG